MRYEELFSHYGYLMLLVGSLGEGMPIMLFGGFAAHRGWLVLMPTVILAGALGNAVAQGLWFFSARYAGEKILEKRADWARNVEHINGWVKRWEGLAVVGARFIPGMSSAAVIAIALSDISATRFVVLNIVGALLWATSLGMVGYLLGQAVVALLGDIETYEKPVAMTLLVATVVWIAWTHALPAWRMRRGSV
jgi:membrane protein DedA with SNARE-associated domain